MTCDLRGKSSVRESADARPCWHRPSLGFEAPVSACISVIIGQSYERRRPCHGDGHVCVHGKTQSTRLPPKPACDQSRTRACARSSITPNSEHAFARSPCIGRFRVFLERTMHWCPALILVSYDPNSFGMLGLYGFGFRPISHFCKIVYKLGNH